MIKNNINMTKMIYALLVILTGMRLISIALTPLGLDVEEAQYWQWSTTPDLGYFTKPPMIAWLIGLSTSIFGENSFGVRALAPILHAIIAILILKIGTQIHSHRAGALGAIIWMTLPISALGAQIMSTDSPMLTFLLTATLLISPAAKGQKLSNSTMLIAGLFTGLAMLSKYAAIYFPIGLIIWWLWSGRLEHTITLKHWASYAVGTLISLLPNLMWNLKNGFVTARHLSHNANLDEPEYSILGSLEFLFSQMGVVGPVIFVMAILAIIIQRNDNIAKFWISLFIPAILVITVQAFFSDANANWAVASWPPAIILLAGYCDQFWKKTRKPYLIGIGLNAGISAVFLIAVLLGSFGPLTPASDPLRRLKAWDLHAQDILNFARSNETDQIVVMRRGHASKLIWELRSEDITVAIVDQNGIAENHFEQQFAWSPQPHRLSVFVNGEMMPPDLMKTSQEADIQWQNISETSSYQISEKRSRTLIMHLGLEQ